MSTTETEDTSFKTVFLINHVVYELPGQRAWLPVPCGYEMIVDQWRDDEEEANDEDPFN
ncbi:hypothetical protein BDR04DRAFT_206981 [Suillus decipiens]|nr:hypothetical protein BDR04DRAFT_206981 [Suillus decipiens]